MDGIWDSRNLRKPPATELRYVIIRRMKGKDGHERVFNLRRQCMYMGDDNIKGGVVPVISIRLRDPSVLRSVVVFVYKVKLLVY